LTPTLLVVLASCATPSAAGPSAEAALTSRPDALFQLRSRGCEQGNCPIFSVAIYTDGAVIFEGGLNVKAVGQVKRELAGAEVASLLDTFHKVDFIDTPERCCECPDAPKNPRAPRITIDYRPGGVEKEILIDERCDDLPQGIRSIVAEIEGLALVRSLVGPTRA
jgi:hypothetical protein